ncbi:hypothetical protein [Paenibacillus donghaensis]|uniref:Uncharacterized protein n=1 Tax=Paenibacillus donghaensis TaxID=414771 RepID=A0A2Z2KQJ2_9BACL|nr:hypothetical protein [Paenibacillus donghaensis]ASA22601.1 hypothetical protein B9T62_18515 [Paenibacillus donghaensis]
MKKEIFSSCCAIGGGTEEVHVLKSECPVQREYGSREVESLFGKNKGEKREECTCIYSSEFPGGVRACQNYKGIKKVQRNKKTEWKVFCDAIQE